MERNEYLERDGLYWESDTHEWFHDKISTGYAQSENANGIALKNIYAFVVRNKATGEYDRVLMNSDTNEIVYSNKVLENIGMHIDQLKFLKSFK